MNKWRVTLIDDEEIFEIEAAYVEVKDGQFLFWHRGLKKALSTSLVAEVTGVTA